MKNTEPATNAQLEQWASSGRDYEAEYKKEIESRKRENHETKCCDCGRFVAKNEWEPKTSKLQPICNRCSSKEWYF